MNALDVSSIVRDLSSFDYSHADLSRMLWKRAAIFISDLSPLQLFATIYGMRCVNGVADDDLLRELAQFALKKMDAFVLYPKSGLSRSRARHGGFGTPGGIVHRHSL